MTTFELMAERQVDLSQKSLSKDVGQHLMRKGKGASFNNNASNNNSILSQSQDAYERQNPRNQKKIDQEIDQVLGQLPGSLDNTSESMGGKSFRAPGRKSDQDIVVELDELKGSANHFSD